MNESHYLEKNIIYLWDLETAVANEAYDAFSVSAWINT